VYLNCCSTNLITELQATHEKVPYNNSGLISEVLVTVPVIVNNFPTLSVFSSRILFLKKESLICFFNRLLEPKRKKEKITY